jgi:hypothetical protein
MAAIVPNFKPSTDVQEIPNGKVRDATFDAPVREAWKTPGKVFEMIVYTDDEKEEIRKGLARSAKFLHDHEGLPVRVADEYRAITVEETDAKGKKTGTTVPAILVLFAAVEKRPSPRSKKTDADNGSQDELPADESADEKAPELQNA